MTPEPKKPSPSGWPRVSTALYYRDARAAIDWLVGAFGFTVQMVVEGPEGEVQHSELRYGDGMLMVADSTAAAAKRPGNPGRSPRDVDGANTQTLCVYVDDVDAHCERARAAGATIAEEPSTVDYGEGYWSDRNYRAVDPEGHHWWFMQRLRG